MKYAQIYSKAREMQLFIYLKVLSFKKENFYKVHQF